MVQTSKLYTKFFVETLVRFFFPNLFAISWSTSQVDPSGGFESLIIIKSAIFRRRITFARLIYVPGHLVHIASKESLM